MDPIEKFQFDHLLEKLRTTPPEDKLSIRKYKEIIQAVIENYTEAIVHYSENPTDSGWSLTLNKVNLNAMSHVFATYGGSVGRFYTSIRFVFDSDFTKYGDDRWAEAWDPSFFPNLEVITAEDTVEPVSGSVDEMARRAAVWRNGPLRLLSHENDASTEQLRIKRCLTPTVMEDLADIIHDRNQRLHSINLRYVSDEPGATLIRAILSPRRPRKWKRVILPFADTLRAFPGMATASPPTASVAILVLKPGRSGEGFGPYVGGGEWFGIMAWKWLSSASNISCFHISNLTSLQPSEWDAVTNWDVVRSNHFHNTTRLDRFPKATAEMVILEHNVVPGSPPHYARRSVIGQVAQHLRVIMHNKGTSGNIPSFKPNILHYEDDFGVQVKMDGGKPEPLWWNEIDDQAMFLKDAINVRDIRSFGGNIVLTKKYKSRIEKDDEWIRYMFIDFLYIILPALCPPFFVTRKYHVRFLLDGSKSELSPTAQRTVGSDPEKCRIAFDRALSINLERYKYANPQSGPVRQMHDAVMELWDVGDIRFIAPGKPAWSTSERNAFLLDIP